MQSDSSLPPFPRRLLRRAGKILTGTGQVVKELRDADHDGPTQPSIHKSNSIGATIKRRLWRFRDNSAPPPLNRSHTIDPNSTKDAVERRKGHSKSLSDVGPIVTSHALKGTQKEQRRPLSLLPQLPTVAERSQLLHLASPVLEDTDIASSPAGDVRVPQLLQQGTPMTKVSAKRHKKFVFRLDADLGQIVWQSNRQKIIPIENIKEIRSGEGAKYDREQFQFNDEYEARWLTIIYIMDGNYKTLHLIPATKEVCRMWDKTLRELHALRLELMSGLGNDDIRERLWEKHYWKGADEVRDHRLVFDEVVKLCRRLNINSSQEDLYNWFKQADTHQRDFLDFHDFQRFVKLLKSRPDIDRLYKKLRSTNNGLFDFGVFRDFVCEEQKSTPDEARLQALFTKYSTIASLPVTKSDSELTESSTPSCLHGPSPSPIPTITLEGFSAFLHGPDNSVFLDQHRSVWQDMTRPLSEYYISSSHNTYLVGHQLVGESTVEGYIRALLGSCRSVELDIYDGDIEPMIFHGKTLTSKVSLREVCQMIHKYGFVASPYPIIISVEVHCGLAGQDMIAEIMISVFGDRLVRVAVEGQTEDKAAAMIDSYLPVRMKIEELPSPKELEGKILLKTKNRFLLSRDPETNGERLSLPSGGYITDLSTTTSEEDNTVGYLPVVKEAVDGASEGKKARQSSDSSFKEQILKARNTMLNRVKSVTKSNFNPPVILSQSPPSMSVSPPPALSRRTSSQSSTPYASPSPAPRMLPSSSMATTDSEISTSLLAVPPIAPNRPKPKMSLALVALLVYTVGVKFRGLNKKEQYAPEHMFSLSEKAANKMVKWFVWDVIKHTKGHLVRVYPKGTRVTSTNYEPQRFWVAGMQLVALNWQTFDLGYTINHAMFQRNGRCGYVLKPMALRLAQKDQLYRRTNHSLDVTIISAQQLPRFKDSLGHELLDKSITKAYVEVTLFVPPWPIRTSHPGTEDHNHQPHNEVPLRPTTPTPASSPSRTLSARTGVVMRNGFNPIWEEVLSLPFDCAGGMIDLIFVKFSVLQEGVEEPLAGYCTSLGSLGRGYRHLPLHDAQLSQYLFSTLFVRIHISDRSPHFVPANLPA